MIKARLEEREGRFSLSLQGHANYAPYGQDLICAAVSALLHGLCSYVNQLEARGLLKEGGRGQLERGRGYISAQPRRRGRQRIAGAFALAGQVLGLLARHYPENIQLSVYEEEEIF